MKISNLPLGARYNVGQFISINNRDRAPLHRQAGVTLISLLIGMMISLMCISSSLMLYRNLVHVAADTQIDAIYDGQLSSALLTAQLEMQRAGYGMTDTTAPHVATATNNGTVDIFWRYLNGAIFKCRGLRDTSTGSSTRQLQFIQTTDAACTSSADLTSLSWTTLNTLAEFTNRPSPNNPVLTPTLSQTSCWPYGIGVAANHYLITITAPSAAQNNITYLNNAVANSAAAITDNSYSYCLPNT